MIRGRQRLGCSSHTNQTRRAYLFALSHGSVTVRGVDSKSLKDEQIAAFQAVVLRQLRFLGKVRTRMEQLGFPPNDKLYVLTTNAFNAVHALNVELHYMSVKSGVGR